MATETESVPVESVTAAVSVSIETESLSVENAHPTAVRGPRKMAFLIPLTYQ
jgi:hypothetical protein